MIAVADQAEVLVDDQDVPQPVNGAFLGAGEYHAAVERPGAVERRTEAPDADAGLADGPGRGAVEQLRAVVVGTGPGGVACERVGIAETVRGIGLVSPDPVVEVRVVVGDPGAVEPVDRHAPVGFGPAGVGQQPGVSARRAHQRRLKQGNRSPLTHEIAGFNDVNSVGRSEVVVVMDARVGGGRRGSSDEQKAEGVAGAEVIGDQRVVGIDPFAIGRGDALGGRGPGAGIVGVEGTHLDIVKAVSEAADDEGGAGGVLAHGRPTAATTTSVADVVTGEGGLAGVIGSGPGDRQRVGGAGDRHHDHIADGGRDRGAVGTLDGDVKRLGTTNPSGVVVVRFIGDTPARGAA